MKKWILGFLVLLFALPALAAPQVSGNNGGSNVSASSYEVNIFFPQGDTADSEAIFVRGTCVVRATVAGSDVLQVWAVPLVTTAASSGTQVGTNITTSTTTAPVTWNPGTYYVKVKSSTAATGGSTMKITCSNAQLASSGGSITQSTPSTFREEYVTTLATNDPNYVKCGWNVATEGSPTQFAGAKYPGAGVRSGDVPDNTIGWSCNKGVFSGFAYNDFYTAFDFSSELGYRDTTNTLDETWIEWNWDFFSPDYTSALSGITGTFVAGDRVSYSGGGTGYVVSYSAPNITLRHDWGPAAVNAQTITNQTAPRVGNNATMGSITPVAFLSRQFRPFIFVYKTLQKTAGWDFSTNAGDNTVSISAGFLRHHGRIVPGTVASSGTTPQALPTALIASGACNTSATGISATGVVSTDVIRWTFNADVSAVTGYAPVTTGALIIYAYPTTNAVNFKVCNPTSAGITPGAVSVNWIVDRWL